MNSDFTKESVEYYWNALNRTGSGEEKKVADEYLIAFKVK